MWHAWCFRNDLLIAIWISKRSACSSALYHRDAEIDQKVPKTDRRVYNLPTELYGVTSQTPASLTRNKVYACLSTPTLPSKMRSPVTR
jgi:hypothetical protein